MLGRTSDGTVTIPLSIRYRRAASTDRRTDGIKSVRRRMVVRQRFHHLGRRLVGIDPPRCLDECAIILVEVRLASGKQIRQRNLDQLLGLELGQKELLADRVPAG